MTALTFDTHAAVRELIEAGLDERQAEAVTAVVRNAQDALFRNWRPRGISYALKPSWSMWRSACWSGWAV